MNIAVIGSGYVGLVAGACFADMGHKVILVDNDQQKIAALKAGAVPIHENGLPELLARHSGKNLVFSDDLEEAVCASAVVFIAVGTPPTANGDADLSYVEEVACGIAGAINSYKLIVAKSTVPVYTSEWVRKIILRHGVSPELFDVASNPEFLREGTAVFDFFYPDRIIVGSDSLRGTAILREVYKPLISGSYYPEGVYLKTRLIETSTKSAELIKHASNAFLAMKISFINSVACVCESVGADVKEVCEGVGADNRIGPRFLNPGIGYGGSCFPKDLLAFHAVARENGYSFRLLDEVMYVNAEQQQRFLRKVRNALWTLQGKQLGVLGLSFKGGTDDIRESPAIAIIQALLKEGCRVVAYDPAAESKARAILKGNMWFAADPYVAAKGADALLVLTDWEEFSNLDLWRLRAALKYPVVIDGRNLFDLKAMAAAGLTYYSVGR